MLFEQFLSVERHLRCSEYFKLFIDVVTFGINTQQYNAAKNWRNNDHDHVNNQKSCH